MDSISPSRRITIWFSYFTHEIYLAVVFAVFLHALIIIFLLANGCKLYFCSLMIALWIFRKKTASHHVIFYFHFYHYLILNCIPYYSFCIQRWNKIIIKSYTCLKPAYSRNDIEVRDARYTSRYINYEIYRYCSSNISNISTIFPISSVGMTFLLRDEIRQKV